MCFKEIHSLSLLKDLHFEPYEPIKSPVKKGEKKNMKHPPMTGPPQPNRAISAFDYGNDTASHLLPFPVPTPSRLSKPGHTRSRTYDMTISKAEEKKRIVSDAVSDWIWYVMDCITPFLSDMFEVLSSATSFHAIDSISSFEASRLHYDFPESYSMYIDRMGNRYFVQPKERERNGNVFRLNINPEELLEVSRSLFSSFHSALSSPHAEILLRYVDVEETGPHRGEEEALNTTFGGPVEQELGGATSDSVFRNRCENIIDCMKMIKSVFGLAVDEDCSIGLESRHLIRMIQQNAKLKKMEFSHGLGGGIVPPSSSSSSSPSSSHEVKTEQRKLKEGLYGALLVKRNKYTLSGKLHGIYPQICNIVETHHFRSLVLLYKLFEEHLDRIVAANRAKLKQDRRRFVIQQAINAEEDTFMDCFKSVKDAICCRGKREKKTKAMTSSHASQPQLIGGDKEKKRKGSSLSPPPPSSSPSSVPPVVGIGGHDEDPYRSMSHLSVNELMAEMDSKGPGSPRPNSNANPSTPQRTVMRSLSSGSRTSETEMMTVNVHTAPEFDRRLSGGSHAHLTPVVEEKKGVIIEEVDEGEGEEEDEDERIGERGDELEKEERDIDYTLAERKYNSTGSLSNLATPDIHRQSSNLSSNGDLGSLQSDPRFFSGSTNHPPFNSVDTVMMNSFGDHERTDTLYPSHPSHNDGWKRVGGKRKVKFATEEAGNNLYNETQSKLIFQRLSEFLCQSWSATVVRSGNDDAKITLLNSICRLVESRIAENRKDEDFGQDSIHMLQVTMGSLGFANLVVRLVINAPFDRLDVVSRSVHLGNLLLSGGNREVQEIFYDLFQTKKGKEFLRHLRHRMRHFREQVKLRDEETTKWTLQHDETEIEVIENTLIFLQLCCEGHFEKMQNFLRGQNDAERPINMVAECMELFTVYNSEMIENLLDEESVRWGYPLKLGVTILRTLTEYVQGPCRQSQLSLSSMKHGHEAVRKLLEAIQQRLANFVSEEEEDLRRVQSFAHRLKKYGTYNAFRPDRQSSTSSFHGGIGGGVSGGSGSGSGSSSSHSEGHRRGNKTTRMVCVICSGEVITHQDGTILEEQSHSLDDTLDPVPPLQQSPSVRFHSVLTWQSFPDTNGAPVKDPVHLNYNLPSSDEYADELPYGTVCVNHHLVCTKEACQRRSSKGGWSCPMCVLLELEKAVLQYLLGLVEGHRDKRIFRSLTQSMNVRLMFQILDYHCRDENWNSIGTTLSYAEWKRSVGSRSSKERERERERGGMNEKGQLTRTDSFGKKLYSIIRRPILLVGSSLGYDPSRSGRHEDVEENEISESRYDYDRFNKNVHVETAVLIFSFLTKVKEHPLVANIVVSDTAALEKDNTVKQGRLLKLKLQDWKEVRFDKSKTMIQCEILNRNGELEKIFFKIPDLFLNNTSRWITPLKRDILEECSKLSSMDERLQKFLRETDRVVEALEHEDKLARTRRCGGLLFFLRNRGWWKTAYVTALLANVAVMLFAFQENPPQVDSNSGTLECFKDGNLIECEGAIEFRDDWFFKDHTWVDEALIVLGLIHTVAAFLMVGEYFVTTGYLHITQELEREKVSDSAEAREEKKVVEPRGWRTDRETRKRRAISLVTATASEAQTTSDDSMVRKIHSITRKRKGLWSYFRNEGPLFFFSRVMSIPRVLYYTIYIIFSLLAVTVSPFYNAFHLLDVVVHSRTLSFVVTAASLRVDQIAATVFLGVVTVYLFTVIGFTLFQGWFGRYTFGPDAVDSYDCSSLWECFQTHVDLGFHSSPQWATDERIQLISPLFDFMFFFLVNVILVSVITGIIIDTFGEMRSEKDRIEQEIRNHCFICGKDRDTFNLHGRGFRRHIMVEHNMWGYVYLRHYLKLKHKHEPTELTGQESYVLDLFNRHDVGFFPIGQAMSLPTQFHNGASRPNDDL